LARRARKKLPKEMKRKVDEWNFLSGAVIMSMAAYKDGDDVRYFQ